MVIGLAGLQIKLPLQLVDDRLELGPALGIADRVDGDYDDGWTIKHMLTS